MTRLPEFTPFGDYTVHRFIKAGLYNDSYIVKDAQSEDKVWWTSEEYKNDNKPMSE